MPRELSLESNLEGRREIPLIELEGKRLAAEKRRCKMAFYMFDLGEKK